MRVLVTGAAGIVGRSVALGLIDRGHHVRLHDIRPVEGISGHKSSCSGDLADLAAVNEAASGMEVIVHLGGSPGIQGTRTQRTRTCLQMRPHGTQFWHPT
eukprot:COSAG05_NODE_2289_length_3270_cov_1.558814_4_plen_100_part_00